MTYDDLERLFEALGRALVFLRRLPFRLEEGDLVQLFQRHGRQRWGDFFRRGNVRETLLVCEM